MLKALFRALKVQPQEEKQVILLLGNGFFLGSFLATYQVGAETLFLNRLPHFLEEAFLAAGLLGIITTALFSAAQSRINFSRLIILNSAIIVLFIAGLYLSYNYFEGEQQDIVVFLMFAMIGPITAVILLGFWGVFARLFDLRQSKRIIGWIDSGQLLAALLTFFAIPVAQQIIGATDNLFLFSAASLIISSLFMVAIVTNFELKQGQDEERTKETRRKTRLGNMMKDNYVRILSSFLLFSMVAFIFVQYSFQDAVSMQYPDEEELRNFIAFFEAFILLFMFFLQTFINDRILSEYGIKIALMILPIVLAVFTVLSILAGNIWGFLPDQGEFIFFFMAIALSRLFSKSLRDALENPTFKLYFMPLDNKIRFDIQTKVEGIVNEMSRFIGGLIILLLSFVPFFQIIHFSYLLVAIIVAYLYFVGKMYAEYRNKIRIKLEDTGEKEQIQTPEKLLISNLESTIGVEDSHRVIFSFKLLEKIDPQLVTKNVNRIMDHKSNEVRDYAQIRINEIKGLSVSERYIVSYDPKSKEHENRIVLDKNELQEMFELGDITTRRILKLSRSGNADDRLYAAELIINSSNPENISILIELLNDTNFNVRITALKAAQQRYNHEVLLAVIRNLAVPRYSNQAMDTLVVVGGKGLNTLDAAFYISGQSTIVMIKIVQIMGKIGGNKAKSMLWNKVDYPDKIVASQVLIALGQSGFKAGISQITNIKYAIESDIEDISWNMAAIGEVSNIHYGREIVQALREENEHDIEHIYMLLGMLYDPTSIQLVKENIESGTNEGVSFAIELLDVFLSDDLKQRIIPIIDDLSESEKFKKLEIFYPRFKMSNLEVLRHLMNREFNQTNHWTKSCVIYQIGLMKHEEYQMDLIANLFNPDPLIREISAWSLHNMNPDYYEEHTSRLNHDVKNKLDFLILQGNEHLLKFNKIRFMKDLEMFKSIHGLTLSELADMSENVVLAEGGVILVNEHSNYNFFLIYKGKVTIHEKDMVREANEGEFIGEVFSSQSRMQHSYIQANEPTVLLKFYKDSFYDYLADHVSLANHVVEAV